MKQVLIVGLGYVGLPLAFEMCKSGVSVIGLDIDSNKVNLLNNGISVIDSIADVDIEFMLDKGFKASLDARCVSDVDAIVVCVPTPLNKNREPDLSYVVSTLESVAPYLKKGQVLSLESTTWPGTTREVLKPIIESQGFVVGVDFYLVYSPEREDPGNQKFNASNIPKVVGGITDACLEIGCELYQKVVQTVVPVSSPEVAEMTKLLENIYRAVNIGLVNEMKIVADKMDIDIFEVIDAAATKPFGYTPYYPGPGIGGHCIPIDPFYLTWKAREFGVHTRFIELAGEVNAYMPEWVVSKISNGLNKKKLSVNESNILLLGLAYKKNVDDLRESPSLEILRLLLNQGANVDYYDPHIPAIPKMRKFNFDKRSINPDETEFSIYDAVVILTNHDGFDYKRVESESKLIIDARGVYRELSEKVVRA